MTLTYDQDRVKMSYHVRYRRWRSFWSTVIS